MARLALNLCVTVLILTGGGFAILTIRQGRTVPGEATSVTSIVGIATAELGSSPSSRPTYYFECITNLNNGSGIRWTRMSAQHQFQVIDIPDGTPGKRLDTAGMDYSDLDVYTCSDRYSNDVASVNITAFNPAIIAAEKIIGVLQGQTVQLEVYVSGFPTPTSSHITWLRPDRTEIMDTDTGVAFQDGKRRLVISNVQPLQAGSYECFVEISIAPYLGDSTAIQLEVYVPPTFISQPQQMLDATEWTEVVLNCSTSGTPIPMIRWEREGGAQLPVGAVPSEPFTSGNIVTRSLTFDKVRYVHRGRYRCVADNIVTSPAMSQYTNFRVTPALRLEDERMQSVNDIYSVENEVRVRLECFGTGNLQWSSSTGLQILSDGSGNIYQSYDHTRDALALVIQNFTSVTIATYTCMTNLTDAHYSPITISVLITSSNPAVIIQSEIQYVLSGSSTTLEARVFASPLNQAVVQWYHEGRLIDYAGEPSYTASSSGDLYRLTVSGVSRNEVGEYTIIVTLNGLNATDRITLLFPDPPSATITPSSITVSEGEEVRFTCDAQGSGALTVVWSLFDGSLLPVGVQENGNSIYIASATSSHPGTYVCSVSNLAGTALDEATLTVYYSPTAAISYNRTMSTPGQPLHLIFDHGAPAPTITCSADGYLPPTVEWIKDNGRGLPIGILQQNAPSSNGEAAIQLRWQREMEFTDSGSYICRASNNNGSDSATLELLVQIQLTISSIYPSNSIIEQDSQQTLTFTVPVDYVGRALVCTANGWPVPVVEWHKNNVPVPSNGGIVSESTTASSTVSATLRWTRGFLASDADSYQCVVYKQNTDIPVTSQTVQLNARLSTTASPTSKPCSVQQTSIHFQIRVFATNCESWGEAQRAEIASEFYNALLSVVRTKCNCTFEDGGLQVSELALCSSKVNGAAVFHGRIKTNPGSQETEQIFCSLLSWQQESPLIRINDQLRPVDNNCSLEASSLITVANECIAPRLQDSQTIGAIEIAVIVVVVIVAMALALLVVIIKFCIYFRRVKTKGNNDINHIYDDLDQNNNIRLQNINRKESDQVPDPNLLYERTLTHNEKIHTYEDMPVHEKSHTNEKLVTDCDKKAQTYEKIQTYEKVQTYEKLQTYEKAPMFDLEKAQVHVRPQLYEGVRTYETAQTYETLPKTAHDLQLQHLVHGTDV